jgi:hypothetical protein
MAWLGLARQGKARQGQLNIKGGDFMKESDIITKPLAEKGSRLVNDYFDGKIEGGEKVKMGAAMILAHIKLKATEANDDTNKLGIVKLLYQDPKIRENYIKKTMPHMLIEKK